MVTVDDIKKMSYVDFMALLEETNRPPGGKESIRKLIQNTFLTENSKVLDIGCNTGYCSFEIAHIVNCQVVGIDINKSMIGAANRQLKKDLTKYQKLIRFLVADAMNLPFRTEEFDLVFSGGSTAFIENKTRALREYKRVCKKWGFIGDINFYYHTSPPTKLIEKLNKVMGVNIKPWNKDYWVRLYRSVGLEEYFIFGRNNLHKVSPLKVKEYCQYMAEKKKWNREIKTAIYKKLVPIMNLFNENHRYLAYGIFIYRKRVYEEERPLFAA